jgi:single-strand DNA-binding protein
MNVVVMIGNITKEPEIAYTKTDKMVAKWSIAVNHTKKEDGAMFFNCIAYGDLAKLMDQYSYKGMKVCVQGELHSRVYENAQNQKVNYVEIICREVQFLSRKEEPKQSQSKHQEENYFDKEEVETPAITTVQFSNDDLPF